MGLKRKETVQVIGELISNWIIPFKIDSVIDNGDGTYRLNTCKTHYLVAGKYRKIIIDAISYTIKEVSNNEYIVVSGTQPPVAATINLPVPHYFNGTIVQTSSEIKKEKDLSKKTPMIFLRRPFPETIDAADLNYTDTANTANLTLYFLTEANFSEWMTSEHDLYAIKPMRNMVYEFIEMLKKNKKYISRFTDYEATDLIKFGVITQNGVDRGLFSDNYSGVQVDITLGIKYQCICPD